MKQKAVIAALLLILAACAPQETAKPGLVVQLQNAQLSELAARNISFAVVDAEKAGWTAEQLAAFEKPNASIRVLGLVSVGTASPERSYWKPEWEGAPPVWLGDDIGAGKRQVKYWEQDWQQIVVTQVRQLLEANYSGVLLDDADVNSYWEEQNFLHTEKLMVDLISDVSSYAKSRDAGFLIVVRNGTMLAHDGRFVSAVDGVSAEEVWYSDNLLKSPRAIAEAEGPLDTLQGKGKLIFTIDYPDKKRAACDVYRRAQQKGYYGYVGTHALDQPVWFDCSG